MNEWMCSIKKKKKLGRNRWIVVLLVGCTTNRRVYVCIGGRRWLRRVI